MSVVGYSTLEVIPSVVKLRANLEKQTAGDMAAAGKTAGAKFGDEAGKAGGSTFKSKFSGALKGYAPFAGLAIAAGAGALFKSAIAEASSLAESANKINVVFGDAAGQVNAFADAASEGLGQSDLQARNAAASFGVYGKAAQLAGSDLGEFATSLTGLSSDLASFFDTDIQTAIDAIGSGLRGEAEPLRQFGVLLDDATLRSQALKMGLIETTKDALTPQQKVLAAYASIMKQTKDAQGDFARTSDGLANSSRDLAADWADMRAELGAKLLPAVLTFVSFLKDDALPALSATGGAIKSAVGAFNDLPGPVKAAAAAFVALKAAAALGLGTTVAAGAAKLSSGMTGLRIRMMLATDAARATQASTAGMGASMSGAATGAGRLTAALAGVRAASTGAGTALRTGLGRASAMVGGPWTIALTAGIALLAHFWTEQQEAKAHVDELTDSLNKQTGALTESTREIAKAALEEQGLLEMAEDMGLNLKVVTDAALGSASAFRELEEAQLASMKVDPLDPDRMISGDHTNNIEFLIAQLHDEAGALAEAREEKERLIAADGQAAASSGRAADSTDRVALALSQYKSEIQGARAELQKLIDAEKERALNLIQNRRDAIALRATLRAAHEEAAKGNEVLFDGSRAADENMAALLDLAEQWNNSTDKVRNAEGAYESWRRKLINVAQSMTDADGKAKKLAISLLSVPETVGPKYRSEGYAELLAQIRTLNREAQALSGTVEAQFSRFNIAPGRYATGGLIGGYGTGTSDSNIIRASRGEFMQPKASVDYYGQAFMEAIRRRIFPKIPGYAQGGMVEPVRAPVAAVAGLNVGHMTVVAQDWRDFVRKGQQKAQSAMSDGVNWG